MDIPLSGLDMTVTAQLLTADAFAPFGAVIQNPRPDVHPSAFSDAAPLPFDAMSANQGTAIQYQHVTRMVNHYAKAPSGIPGAAVVSMFVSAARQLRSQAPGRPPSTAPASASSSFFDVNILERHPYTTQTFTPLSSSGTKPTEGQNRYLVIVVPNLAPASGPQSTHTIPSPPDLSGLKAFVATTDQAVTYGAGTWHAPMVALGPDGSTVDFVVTQFKNAVAEEDCEMVSFGSSGDGTICVEVPASSQGIKSKL